MTDYHIANGRYEVTWIDAGPDAELEEAAADSMVEVCDELCVCVCVSVIICACVCMMRKKERKKERDGEGEIRK